MLVVVALVVVFIPWFSYIDAPVTEEQYYELQALGAPTCEGQALVREFARQHVEASARDLTKIRTRLSALNSADRAANARRKILGETTDRAAENCGGATSSIAEPKDQK